MDRQLFLSRKWHYFCQVCQEVDAWGPDSHGRIICQRCFRKRERKRAKGLGLPFSDATPDEDVLSLLDQHHTVCQYISIAWNECLTRRKGTPTITDGDNCPWSPTGAVSIPKDAIERTAVRLMRDESLIRDINESMFAMYGEHFAKSTKEVDPRYDTGQFRTVKGYWPAVPKDFTFNRIAPMLWERWNRYLPLRVC